MSSTVRIPTPEAFVAYVNDINARMEVLVLENKTLRREVCFERALTKEKNATIIELQEQVNRMRCVSIASELVSYVEELKNSNFRAMAEMQKALQKLEDEVSKALADPRLRELDGKLLRLGRILKRNEGVDRVVMELEVENAYLHNELDAVNASLREFKAMNARVFGVNKHLEEQLTQQQSVMVELKSGEPQEFAKDVEA
jgi:hypothetical protein